LLKKCRQTKPLVALQNLPVDRRKCRSVKAIGKWRFRNTTDRNPTNPRTKEPLRGSCRNGFELYEQVFADLVNGKLPESDELFTSSDQGAKSFGQKFGIEWLLERFVDRGTIEAHRAAVVGQQGDQDRFPEVGILAQVLADL
jgi:hypothetical protein